MRRGVARGVVAGVPEAGEVGGSGGGVGARRGGVRRRAACCGRCRWFPCRLLDGVLARVAQCVVARPLLCVVLVAVLSAALSVPVCSLLWFHRLTLRDWLMVFRVGHFVAPADPLEIALPAGLRVTLVLMSFGRPENVRKLAKHYLSHTATRDVVEEVLVWDANPAKGGFPEISENPRVTLISARPDVGLHSRFAGAILARNPTVVIQDDDLQVDVSAFRELLRRHASNPSVLHSLWARLPTKHEPYPLHNPDGSTSAAISLTKLLVGRRELFAQFFVFAPHLAPLAAVSKPVWNAEDILASLAVVRANQGALNARHGDLVPHTLTMPATDPNSRDQEGQEGARRRMRTRRRTLGVEGGRQRGVAEDAQGSDGDGKEGSVETFDGSEGDVEMFDGSEGDVETYDGDEETYDGSEGDVEIYSGPEHDLSTYTGFEDELSTSSGSKNDAETHFGSENDIRTSSGSEDALRPSSLSNHHTKHPSSGFEVSSPPSPPPPLSSPPSPPPPPPPSPSGCAFPGRLLSSSDAPSHVAISAWRCHMLYRKEFTKTALVLLGLGVPDWGMEELPLPVVASPPLLAPLPWEEGYVGVFDRVMESGAVERGRFSASVVVKAKGRTTERLPLLKVTGPEAFGHPTQDVHPTWDKTGTKECKNA